MDLKIFAQIELHGRCEVCRLFPCQRRVRWSPAHRRAQTSDRRGFSAWDTRCRSPHHVAAWAFQAEVRKVLRG